MPRNGRPSPARLLAPLALALFALALVLVVFASNAGDDGDTADSGAAGDRRPVRSPAREARGAGRRATTYTVKTGDTLGAIAAETGVTVERLLELNPELDPQTLVSGQKIKLRE